MDEFSCEFDEEREFTVQPYMYEPEPTCFREENTSSEDESDDEISDDREEIEVNGDRLGCITWCECRSCGIMQTATESKCCQEYPDLTEKLDGIACITNRDVIEVSFYEFLQINGPIGDEEQIHEVYRYVAYRRLARWIWHRLSKYDRRVLPACAVLAIRENFPSDEYKGFKYSRDF